MSENKSKRRSSAKGESVKRGETRPAHLSFATSLDIAAQIEEECATAVDVEEILADVRHILALKFPELELRQDMGHRTK